ncbi:hypothetical protein SCHPADRAFT_947752 [Schizopora paradoxa]|uniref:Uncharacterized protein n=1 Tax=Schizopora paradoxa TaxID=27342 RepID=A0A0H2QZF6_9AGAM|nr:hypothetical protein SCHPADRAFT_947752 [Schizopora paradoxa]
MPSYLDFLHRVYSTNVPTRFAFDRTPEDALRQANVRPNFQLQIFSNTPSTVLFSPRFCRRRFDGTWDIEDAFHNAVNYEKQSIADAAKAVFGGPNYRGRPVDSTWYCVIRPEQIAALGTTLPPYCDMFWTNLDDPLNITGSLETLKKAFKEQQQLIRNSYAYLDDAIHRAQTMDLPTGMFVVPRVPPQGWVPYRAEGGIGELQERAPIDNPTPVLPTPFMRWATARELEEEHRRYANDSPIRVANASAIPVYDPPRNDSPSGLSSNVANNSNASTTANDGDAEQMRQETGNGVGIRRTSISSTVKGSTSATTIPAPTRANLAAQAEASKSLKAAETNEYSPKQARTLKTDEIDAIKQWRDDCEHKKLQPAPASIATHLSSLLGISSSKPAASISPTSITNTSASKTTGGLWTPRASSANDSPIPGLSLRNERKRVANDLPVRDAQASTNESETPSKVPRLPFRGLRWFAGARDCKNAIAARSTGPAETSNDNVESSLAAPATPFPLSRTLTINKPLSISDKGKNGPFNFNPRASPFTPKIAFFPPSLPSIATLPPVAAQPVMAFAAQVNNSPALSPASSHSSMPGLVEIDSDLEDLPPPLEPIDPNRYRTRDLSALAGGSDAMEVDGPVYDRFTYETSNARQNNSPLPDIEDIVPERAPMQHRRNDKRPSSFQRKKARNEQATGSIDPVERAKGKKKLMPKVVQGNPYVYLHTKYELRESNERVSTSAGPSAGPSTAPSAGPSAGPSIERQDTPFPTPTRQAPPSTKVRDPRLAKRDDASGKN